MPLTSPSAQKVLWHKEVAFKHFWHPIIQIWYIPQGHPWWFHRFLEWPLSSRRHAADSEVSNGPLHAEGTPVGEAHLVALRHEIPRRAFCAHLWLISYAAHFLAYFWAATHTIEQSDDLGQLSCCQYLSNPAAYLQTTQLIYIFFA